jgi:hypothetical protein
MKKPKKISAQDRAFLDRIDALLGDPENSAQELDAELTQLGIDPNELRHVAFQRAREFATRKYSSRGLDIPPRMSEALRQMRPETPEEEEAARSARATSRVRGLLDSLKEVGGPVVVPTTFAPAYRNKHDETPESDEQLLQRQQRELDGESEQ